MEKQSNELGLGILIGVLVTLVVCLSSFIVYDKVLSKDNNNNIQMDNNEDKTENESSNENDSDFDISKFDTTKEAINGASGWAYKPYDSDGVDGLSISINKDKKSATITIDWSKYKLIYETRLNTSISIDENIKYEVTNFTKNIKSVYINGFGQSPGQETAFYIMEDGTVEYTPIIHVIRNNSSFSEANLKSYGKIKDVSGVVTTIMAMDYCPDKNCLGGGLNILGVRSDGNFYDLSKIIYATDYYKFY